MTHVQPCHDAQKLAAVHRQCFDKFWGQQAFERLLQSPHRLALAATERDDSDAIDGFMCLQFVADEAEILTLAVTPPMQRQGVARRLMEQAADFLRQRGIRQWHLEVAADNPPARQVYRRLGFDETGCREAYYDGVDAILMRRDL